MVLLVMLSPFRVIRYIRPSSAYPRKRLLTHNHSNIGFTFKMNPLAPRVFPLEVFFVLLVSSELECTSFLDMDGKIWSRNVIPVYLELLLQKLSLPRRFGRQKFDRFGFLFSCFRNKITALFELARQDLFKLKSQRLAQPMATIWLES